MEYDTEARRRLGRAIRAARVEAGYSKREAFANAVGRSARQIQALENGESGVGPDTWAAAAAVLAWPLERVYQLLDGVVVGGDAQDADYVAAPGERVESSTRDDQVLSELRAMREDINALSRRVARIESSPQPLGGIDGPD